MKLGSTQSGRILMVNPPHSKDIPHRSVHAMHRLDDSAILGHMGNLPINIEAWVQPVTCTQDRESQGAHPKTWALPAADQGTLAWSLSRAAWQGSAATKPTGRSWVEGTMKTSVSSDVHQTQALCARQNSASKLGLMSLALLRVLCLTKE